MYDNLKERLTDMSVLASSRTPADALQYIKELEAENADLKAKLAKAVSFSESVVRYARKGGDGYLADQARTTIAELTGGKDE